MQQDSRKGMGPADEEWTILGQQEQSAGDVWEEILCDMLIVFKKGWYSQRFVTDRDHVIIQHHYSRWIEEVLVEASFDTLDYLLRELGTGSVFYHYLLSCVTAFSCFNVS